MATGETLHQASPLEAPVPPVVVAPSHHESAEGVRVNRATVELGLVLQETYQIRKMLGVGGMGAVYSARDLNLNRNVAIKIPSNAAAARMMEQEAMAMAAFCHRGLPTVYALGRHAEWPFIVMELILGRTVESAILEAAPEGGLPVEQAVRWLCQLMEVVGVLHQANLAHRDLKPENVMLAPGNRLALLDLGILRQERFVADEETISGSPEYMAPETVCGAVRMGEAHLVDLYALGITAFQMLTGACPYRSPDPMAVMQMHLDAPIPRVSSIRDVPPLLDDIVFELMSKDPAERPANIEALQEIFLKLREGKVSLRRRPRTD